MWQDNSYTKCILLFMWWLLVFYCKHLIPDFRTSETMGLTLELDNKSRGNKTMQI